VRVGLSLLGQVGVLKRLEWLILLMLVFALPEKMYFVAIRERRYFFQTQVISRNG